jgi:hypothetical protein
MDTNSPEYREQLRTYLEAVGPVQGSGMAATWAWKVQKERQFRDLVVRAETKSSHKPIV